MNRSLTSVGLVLALAGTFLFYGVFVGLTPGFVAFLSALILLPIGSSVLFFGAAYKGTFSAPPAVAGGGGGASNSTVYAAIAVAVVAILIAVASLSMALSAQSAANNANDQISSVTSGLSTLGGGQGIAPTTVAFKVDWCNTDNTGQDRFCPNELVVNQGDIVQIMFIHNDTDAHTFTMVGTYDFQINGTAAGMHDFLTNAPVSGDCSNAGTFAQESSGVSTMYCVSGTSLMAVTSPATNFKIAQNGNPAASPPSLGDVPIDNQVHIVVFNSTSGTSEVWGIGEFQASVPGIYEFFCHYHVSNGMFGYLIVLPNSYCTSNPSSCGVTGS